MSQSVEQERYPCPCCGHLCLEAAGDYELCPICSWEDDGVQLRWPMSPEGANGISLTEAQRRYLRLGAVDRRMRRHVRRPRPEEPIDEGWRPFDPHVDWTHPELSGDRWPRNREALYYWRATYWNGDVDRLAAAPRKLTGGDHLVEHLRSTVPESRPIIEHLEWLRGTAAPSTVCRRVGELAVKAYDSDDPETGLRLVTAVAPSLDEGSGMYAPICVTRGLLHHAAWRQSPMQPFIDQWPAEVRTEIRRQQAHAAQSHRDLGHQAAEWTDLWATSRGRPVEAIEGDLLPFASLEEHQRAMIARVMTDPRWLCRHPLQAVGLAWRYRESESPLRTLRWLRRPRFSG